MQILHNFTELKFIELKKQQIPLAMALGNFDGVHKGHQALLKNCIEESRINSWSSAVLLWNPHPAQVLKGESQIEFLNTAEQKYQLMEALGMQYLFSLPFDAQIAALSPVEFVQKYLIDLFGVKKVFIGFNYSFGQKGKGTPELLQTLGKKKGFAVSVTEPVYVAGEVVSSSLIRQKFREGNIPAAAQLLGYDPVLEGKVVTGKHRGSGMGFPTANIEVAEEQILPSFGVYAALAEYKGMFLPAVLNIGVKPTFNGNQVTVEVHILDFSKNIYKQDLKVKLIKKIRDEQKFSSKDELKKQINVDIERARSILPKHHCNRGQ